MDTREFNVLHLLAHTYLVNARPAKAAAVLAALDALQPGCERVLAGLALAQLRCGDALQALQTLERLRARGDGGMPVELMRQRALRAAATSVATGASA